MKTNVVLRSRQLFAMIVAAIAISPIQAQTMSFFRQFTTPGIGTIAVAADASGIYAVGNRPAPQGGLGSPVVRKYDSRGNELWAREFSVPALGNVQLTKAATDATGVYVLGFAGLNAQSVLRKYSAEGNELWTRQLDFSSLPGDMAADATGVYVAGRDSNSSLRKYSPDGVELWRSGGGASGVAVDATGVYTLENANYSAGMFVRKLDARGNLLWTRQLPALDVYRAFAAAAPTGFYVLAAAGADGWIPTLRRYDSDGKELWSRRHIASNDPFVWMAADATGVYVAGILHTPFIGGEFFGILPGQCRSGSGADSFLRKYDLDGAEVWTRQFGTADGAWASGVAVDASGVYVLGVEGTAPARDAQELYSVFAPANPVSAAFLAKFETTAAPPAGSGPRIFQDCVVNAASYVGGGVAPGEIVALFGSAMGPSELVRLRLTEDRKVSTTLADTRILFNGVPAPLLYVSDKQSSAIVPYAVAGRTSVDVQVEYKGVRSDPVTVPVLASRPGIFSLDGTGQGQGAILNEDGTVNSPSNPAARGSIITIFGTGGGEAAPGVVDGEIVSGVLPRTSVPVSVFFDLVPPYYGESKPGEVLYAGGVSGSVAGLLQVSVRVPATDWTGERVPFAIIIGSHWEMFQVTIALR